MKTSLNVNQIELDSIGVYFFLHLILKYSILGILSYITRPVFIQKNKKIFKVVLNATILCKCFAAKMWDNSEYVCRQFNGIGPAFASALVSAGKKSLEAIRQSNPRDLERVRINFPNK